MQERDILNKLANVANAQAGDENKIDPYNKFSHYIGGFHPTIQTNAAYNPNKEKPNPEAKKEKTSPDETKKDSDSVDQKSDTVEIVIDDKEMPDEQLSPAKPTATASAAAAAAPDVIKT